MFEVTTNGYVDVGDIGISSAYVKKINFIFRQPLGFQVLLPLP